MEKIDLGKLKERYCGEPFHKLVEYHLKRQKQDTRISGLHGTIQLLPESARSLVEEFIDRWNTKAYDKQFWGTDTSIVFSEIINDARNFLTNAGAPTDDDTLFNMFNVVVMNYAYSVYDQPKMREFVGINGSSFPITSLVSLIYPIAATIYISIKTPANFMAIIGYGITNLGYLLIAAGIIKGTFRVFGLKKRLHVFLAAFFIIIVGFILSNIRA
ncbi:MAG: hypothetical protein ACE5GV_17340 [Candidatus Scalindua sp.]